jgi:hypothetical protein
MGLGGSVCEEGLGEAKQWQSPMGE